MRAPTTAMPRGARVPLPGREAQYQALGEHVRKLRNALAHERQQARAERQRPVDSRDQWLLGWHDRAIADYRAWIVGALDQMRQVSWRQPARKEA